MSADYLRQAAREIREDAPSLDDDSAWHPAVALAVADQIDAFLEVHKPRETSVYSSSHHSAEHESESAECTEACFEDIPICNGCGARDCHEIGWLLPIARAYLGDP